MYVVCIYVRMQAYMDATPDGSPHAGLATYLYFQVAYK